MIKVQKRKMVVFFPAFLLMLHEYPNARLCGIVEAMQPQADGIDADARCYCEPLQKTQNTAEVQRIVTIKRAGM